MDYNLIFERYKQSALSGRFITLADIEPLLKNLGGWADVAIGGESVEKRPLWTVKAGVGPTRVLLWSQMHGNESTATKALFDFFNVLGSKSDFSLTLLQRFTFLFVPMLNPDGAQRYTRENANEIDLNRDFKLYSQPESIFLKKTFDAFCPDFCYNLHDQRTIFGVGDSGKPATISFLAPAFNEQCDWNDQRQKSVTVINAMNCALQNQIPGQVGRFDDTYNENCAGDTFQAEGAATILIEAGHFDEDYEREVTRKHFLTALVAGFSFDDNNDIVTNGIDEYLNIPQNKAVFYDFVYKNIRISYDGNEIITNFAAQYTEQLTGSGISLIAVISAIGNLESYFGHREFDAGGASYSSDFGSAPVIGAKAEFYIGDTQFTNGVPNFKKPYTK